MQLKTQNFPIAENQTIEKKYGLQFVLMYNEYNLYFDSFTKEYPLILSSLNLTRTKNLLDFGWKMD